MQEYTIPKREWQTVDQAFIACQEAGLDRTKKTIRSWARNEHVEAQKQTTPTGERWMLEKASLMVKISSELEFRIQPEPVQTRTYLTEPVHAMDEPVRTRTHQFDHVRTEVEKGVPTHTSNENEDVKGLRSQLRSIEIDKAVRDKQIEFLTKQNEEGQNNLLSQSRYIGHLETQVLQLGGAPDHTFLNAPIHAKEHDPEILNPHQEPLRSVQ
jgi:hypothetical protein